MLYALGTFGGKAFPSGHALQATAVWGMLAVLAASGVACWWRKVLVWSAGAAVAVAVGVSRVYLGAHWLTDVICGWLLGGLWLTALVVAARAVEPIRPAETAMDPAFGCDGGVRLLSGDSDSVWHPPWADHPLELEEGHDA